LCDIVNDYFYARSVRRSGHRGADDTLLGEGVEKYGLGRQTCIRSLAPRPGRDAVLAGRPVGQKVKRP
jgi:hypothetical protein